MCLPLSLTQTLVCQTGLWTSCSSLFLADFLNTRRGGRTEWWILRGGQSAAMGRRLRPDESGEWRCEESGERLNGWKWRLGISASWRNAINKECVKAVGQIYHLNKNTNDAFKTPSGICSQLQKKTFLWVIVWMQMQRRAHLRHKTAPKDPADRWRWVIGVSLQPRTHVLPHRPKNHEGLGKQVEATLTFTAWLKP